MTDENSGVKRPYRQTERARRALETRAKIRSAATRLFLEHGYVSTTMKQIAAEAGIGERTLYDTFPSKSDLYEHVVGVAIASDEQPLAIAQRPEFQSALDADDVDRAIAAFADYATDILERSGPLIMVAVESSGADPAMRAFAARGASANQHNASTFTRQLATMRALKPDAANTVFALVSPHVHQILRRHANLNADEYRRWLAGSISALVVH